MRLLVTSDDGIMEEIHLQKGTEKTAMVGQQRRRYIAGVLTVFHAGDNEAYLQTIPSRGW